MLTHTKKGKSGHFAVLVIIDSLFTGLFTGLSSARSQKFENLTMSMQHSGV